MSFQEIFKRYQEGNATEEEQGKVQEEIEKYELINEYLCERIEIDFDAASSEQAGESRDQAAIFSNLIRRAIRKAFFRFGIAMTSIFLAVILFFQFALSPLLDQLYYDPDAPVGSYANQLTMDLNVYSELHNLQTAGYSAAAYRTGYGCYDITIDQTWSLDGTFQKVGGTIRRGHLTLYDPNILRQMSSNVFASLETMDQWAGGSWQEARKKLENLDEKQYYRIYITFDRDLTFQEWKAFQNDNDTGAVWGAVRTKEPQSGSLINLGFGTSNGMVISGWDDERYPELFTYGKDPELSSEQIAQREANEEIMTTHFLSLLKYMDDNDQLRSLLADVNPGGINYRAAYDYVKENGLYFYGSAALAQKEEILKLADAPHVQCIYVRPLYN